MRLISTRHISPIRPVGPIRDRLHVPDLILSRFHAPAPLVSYLTAKDFSISLIRSTFGPERAA
jgi:hypothetical protein